MMTVIAVCALAAVPVALGVVIVANRNRVVLQMRRVLYRRYGSFGRTVGDAISPTLVVCGVILLAAGVVGAIVRWTLLA
jgi:hypothetical protein